jgi:hypothetical protein
MPIPPGFTTRMSMTTAPVFAARPHDAPVFAARRRAAPGSAARL